MNKHILSALIILLSIQTTLSMQEIRLNDALIKASKQGNLELVQKFINYNADVNAKDKDGRTSLHLATYFGHIQVVELLLSNGANANEPEFINYNALMGATHYGNTAIVKLLLKYGAKVQNGDKLGRNALSIAQRSDRPDLKEILCILQRAQTKSIHEPERSLYETRSTHEILVK